MRIAHAVMLAAVVVGCSSQPESSGVAVQAENRGISHAAVCPGPASHGAARCHARVVVDRTGNPAVTGGPTGYNPADLQAAYVLPSSTGGVGATIALVDAYDYPSAESDLSVYRAQFGL